ncbi:MAG: radical SAM protein [Leptospirales bacterium]
MNDVDSKHDLPYVSGIHFSTSEISNRPSRINFILTNRCNLRCVYCPEGSHPQDYYADLDDNLFEEIVAYIKENGVESAGMAYYGELTMVPDWWKKARRLLDMGVALTACTNGHLPLSPEEVSTFARFKYIEFSIDSHDEATVNAVRKKTSVARIVHNFHLIRAHCIRHKLKMPELAWTGVLSHHVVNQLPDFIAFSHSNGVSRIHFNEIAIYAGAVVHDLNVVDMNEPDFQKAVTSIQEAMEIAKCLGIELTICEMPRINARLAGEDLNTPLVQRSSIIGPDTMNHVEGNAIPEGHTRDCQSPWTELYIDPKGTVFACCNRGEVMGVAKTSAEIKAVFNNDKYKVLREGLKTGRNIDPACATCVIHPVVPVGNTVLTSLTTHSTTVEKSGLISLIPHPLKKRIVHALRNYPKILKAIRYLASQ